MFNNTRLIRHELEQRRPMLYQLAYSWCHQPALADDLVQDTMVKALRNAKQLQNTKAVKAWLTRILANCWYDHLRSSRDMADIDNLSAEIEPRTEVRERIIDEFSKYSLVLSGSFTISCNSRQISDRFPGSVSRCQR